MVCANCGSEIPEGDLFCCVCGQRVPESVPVEEYPEPLVNADNLEKPAETVPEKPKKKGLKLLLLLGGITMVLAALVVVLIFIFKANGPAAAVCNGVKNVLDEQSFSLHIEGDVDGDELEVDMQVEMDPENRELSMLWVYAEDDGEPDMMAIYDGHLIWSGYEYSEYYNPDTGYWEYQKGDLYYRAEDISDELEIFFDAYERLEDGDTTLEEMVEALIDDIGDEDLEEAYEEALDYVNMEMLEDCLKTYCEMLNDEAWMEENANLTVEKEDGMTLYCLDSNMYDFTMTSVEYFKEAFEDEDDFDEIKKQLKNEAKDELKQIEAEITFGIEDGYLVYGTIEGTDGYDTCDVTMEITAIGETEVDKDMLEDILDEAESW